MITHHDIEGNLVPFVLVVRWDWWLLKRSISADEGSYLKTEAPIVPRASLVRWFLSPLLTCYRNYIWKVQSDGDT